MYDENKMPLTPDPAAPAPEQEPDEVVSWYVRPDEGQEITDCYVQPGPMPAAAAPKAVRQEKRRSRKGLWTFLVILAVLVGVVLGVAIVSALRGGNSDGYGGDFDDGDHDASSIVDIFQSDVPTIPRADTDPDLRFYCEKTGEEKLTIQQVYQQVNPATVLVVADQGENASVGTGIIMTSDGYIVTNAHVISGGRSCWIALDTGYTYDAELVGYDEDQDLAVLKAVDAEDLPTAEFGDSDQCRVGDTVYAIGNPLGVELRGTLTEGIISAINRNVQMEGRVMTLIQTTAALNNGNSGGPLINEYGQVIGVNTLKMSGSGNAEEATVEGLGFALPSSSFCFVVNDLIANGQFRGIPVLGITVMNSDDGRVVVYTVSDGYGAAEMGIRPDDVLLRADGQALGSIDDLMAVRRTHLVGDTITLTVLRDGQTFDVDVPLYASAD